ncbi:hypothetical protein EJ02DRAFT_447170 [Clathrospora elynae]|uniref:NAD(P)-binding domain-containing protein n=1 Tax=Clathrospora elynae TaxID=706981 RepID=A0A6A5SEJ4_9PLEO|nr:hypothetical protein EJ02DRAFT_447170 [Clathrospora elynae]
MNSANPLRVGVIGPAGCGGSLELLNRGNTVIRLSCNLAKLSKHARYIPRPVDMDKISVEELAQHLEGVDFVVSEYGSGAVTSVYMQFLETVRKLILAYKLSPASYFLFVGGAESLHVPGTATCCADNPDFFLAYRRAILNSLAHVAYVEERFGSMGAPLRRYREARMASDEPGKATEEEKEVVKEYEKEISAKDDSSSDFIKAARTAYMFFDGNQSFRWGFVSPSALYRPGKRTGKQGKDIFEGRLTGISVADLAIVIADEVEQQKLDIPAAAYLKLDVFEGGSA